MRSAQGRPLWAGVAALLATLVPACASSPPDATQFCGVFTQIVRDDPIARAEVQVEITSILASEFGREHRDALKAWLAIRAGTATDDAAKLTTLNALDKLHQANCVPSEEDERVLQEQLDDQRVDD